MSAIPTPQPSSAEPDEPSHSELDEPSHSELDELSHSEPDELSHSEPDEPCHSEPDEPCHSEPDEPSYPERLHAAMARVPDCRELAVAAAKWLWTECCASTDLGLCNEYIALLRVVDHNNQPLLTFAEKLDVYNGTPSTGCDSFEAYMWLNRREHALHSVILLSLTTGERRRDFDAIRTALDRELLRACPVDDPAFHDALEEEARLAANEDESADESESAGKSAGESETESGAEDAAATDSFEGEAEDAVETGESATADEPEGPKSPKIARVAAPSEVARVAAPPEVPTLDVASLPCRGTRGCVEAQRCCPRLFLGAAPAEWPPADRRAVICPELAAFEEKAARAHDPAAEHDWSVYHFWDDGSVTSQKADNLLWERSLFQTLPAIARETPLCVLPFESIWEKDRTCVSLSDLHVALVLRAELLAATGRADAPENESKVAFTARLFGGCAR